MAKKHSEIQAKYDKTHCKYYTFKFHLVNDADVIDQLSKQDSMQGYIKRLIREDRSRFVPVSAPKTYKIKPEYLDMWEGGDSPSDPDRIITEDDVRTFSEEWDVPVSDLLEQLIEQ